MSNELSIDAIKERHDALDTKILEKSADLTEPKEKSQLMKEVENLIGDISKLAETVDSFADYRWLSDAAIKWQSVLSTIFESPTNITLPMPRSTWLPQNPSVFSEEEIDNWLKSDAAFIAYARRAEMGSNNIDVDSDWHIAEVFFASEILEGKINFAGRISSKSYWRLENIWVKEVKEMMAYFDWVKTRDSEQDKHFFEACDHVRKALLINSKIKARLSEFDEAKSYIKQHYLDEKGKLLPRQEGSEVYQLIERKAYRIYETTGSKNELNNWVQAETYTKMFYENIIPAVVEKDSESVLQVLKAFQYSKTQRFFIINCFETALAIYFLNPDIIKSLWADAAQEPIPESTVESFVEVYDWPQKFKIGELCEDKIEVDLDWNRISFKGVMSDSEKKELLDALNTATEGNPKTEHITAIEKLYSQSRLIHEETTL